MDGPFVAKVIPPVGFTFKGELDPMTPICAPCKDKNYTRTYCRQHKNHRQLPWSTVYVIVSLEPSLVMHSISMSSPSSTAGRTTEDLTPESQLPQNKRRKKNEDDNDHDDEGDDDYGTPNLNDVKSPSSASRCDQSENQKVDSAEITIELHKTESQEDGHDADSVAPCTKDDAEEGSIEAENVKDESVAKDISDKQQTSHYFDNIPRSRTFLATVSCNTNKLTWVELDRMLECQLPTIFQSNKLYIPQDNYDMRHTRDQYHGMQPPSPYFGYPMNASGMMDYRGGNAFPNPSMRPNHMMPYMGSNFDHHRTPPPHWVGSHPRMGNHPSGHYGQEMMGHFGPTRRMSMSHMQPMGGPVPVETPSMQYPPPPSSMDYGGGYQSQDMFYNNDMMHPRHRQSQTGYFDRQQQMMQHNMPLNAMGGNMYSGGAGGMPMDHRMGSMSNNMRRPSMSMSMNRGNTDGSMTPMHYSGEGQSMMGNPGYAYMHQPGNSDMMTSSDSRAHTPSRQAYSPTSEASGRGP